MARPRPNLKMGINHDARAKITDKTRHSVGDLLGRAITMRTVTRWSALIMELRKIGCRPSNILTLQSFIENDAPFLGTCGTIDPRAVEEVLTECGGLHHLKLVTYNVTTDPRSKQVTDHLRLLRNGRYVRKLKRTGEINGGSGKSIDEVLKIEVPLATDRSLIRGLISKSGYNGNGRFDTKEFDKAIALLGWGTLEHKDVDFRVLLDNELGELLQDGVIHEEAVAVRPSITESVVPEPPRKTLPVSMPAAPLRPAVTLPEAPALVKTETTEAEQPKKLIPLWKIYRQAHSAFERMLEILVAEYSWPFPRALPGEFMHGVILTVSGETDRKAIYSIVSRMAKSGEYMESVGIRLGWARARPWRLKPFRSSTKNVIPDDILRGFIQKTFKEVSSLEQFVMDMRRVAPGEEVVAVSIQPPKVTEPPPHTPPVQEPPQVPAPESEEQPEHPEIPRSLTLEEVMNNMSPDERMEFVRKHFADDLSRLVAEAHEAYMQKALANARADLEDWEKKLANAQAEASDIERKRNAAALLLQRLTVLEPAASVIRRGSGPMSEMKLY